MFVALGVVWTAFASFWIGYLVGVGRRKPENVPLVAWNRKRRLIELERLEAEITCLQRQVRELKWPRGG